MDDPMEIPLPDQRYVMIGESQYFVTPNEWVAANLKKGDRAWVEPKRGNSFLGLVVDSHFYDGIVLRMQDLSDVDNPTDISVWPEWDSIWPERGAVMISSSKGNDDKEEASSSSN